jgi:Ras-related protein Rab-11A
MDDEEYSMIFKIILIGDSGVGKSNILSRYVNNYFSESSKSTVGVELGCKIEEINGTKVKVQIWDTAGQERYKSITQTYYKGAKGALIVYDISRKESFLNVDKWIGDLKEFGEEDVCVIIVGNKCDLEDFRQVSTDEVSKKAEQYSVGFCETSALSAKNIDTAFQMLIKKVSEKIPNMNDKYGNKSSVVNTGVSLDTKIISEDQRPKNNKNKCC